MHLTESPTPLPVAPGFPWSTAIHKLLQPRLFQFMKSDKVTAGGSVVVRPTRVLVQKSGNPWPSETKTCMSIQFMMHASTLSVILDKAIPVEHWRAYRKLLVCVPVNTRMLYFKKVSDKCGCWTGESSITVLAWESSYLLGSLRASPCLLPRGLTQSPHVHLGRSSRGALICMSWRIVA